ncbi:hypothetical protein LTR66_006427 [Elasticomyces elasticus]|nr:hypothetical protein LTR66_006427 [Elasticomyces elasticus]
MLGQNLVTQSPAESTEPSTTTQVHSVTGYHTSDTMSVRGGNHGFLGATSSSAIFAEDQANLGMEVSDCRMECSASPASTVASEKVQKGAELLLLLKHMTLFNRFTRRWFDLCEGVVVSGPLYRIWTEGLSSAFGDLLAHARNSEDLLGLSELVWRNTHGPLTFTGTTTAREWAAQATGKKLRWEIVGIVVSMVGLISTTLSDRDPVFESCKPEFANRAAFARDMRAASDVCLSFCRDCEAPNEMYLCFLYENALLLTMIKGDTSYSAWQRTGEVANTIIAMGLHQSPKASEVINTPFFLAELRKKIFASAYGVDKSIATFLGRPPRISQRYCTMELPLDLRDDQLILEGEELQLALRGLDADGWNTSGVINRCTWARVSMLHTHIREDILEIALGVEVDDITARARQIRQRLTALHASLPAFVKYNHSSVTSVPAIDLSNGSSPPTTLWATGSSSNVLLMTCIHAEFLHNEFLLQRALVKRTMGGVRELIPVARNLLALVLLVMSKKDFLRDFQGDLVWMMADHGLPCAGVLAIELLKQEQSHQYNPILPRSETIQDLSVFISNLATVDPGEGIYTVCNQGRRALKRILDKILSPGPSVASAEVGNNDTGVGQSSVAAGVGGDLSLCWPTGDDSEFLQWLESAEWEPRWTGVGRADT